MFASFHRKNDKARMEWRRNQAEKEPTLMKLNLDYSNMGNHTFDFGFEKMIADTSPPNVRTQLCVFTHYATSLTQNKCKFIALFLVLSCLDLTCLVTELRSVASVVLLSSTLSIFFILISFFLSFARSSKFQLLFLKSHHWFKRISQMRRISIWILAFFFHIVI